MGITTGSGWAAEPSPGDSPQGRSAEEGIDPPEPQPGGLLFLAAAKLTLCRGFAHVVRQLFVSLPPGEARLRRRLVQKYLSFDHPAGAAEAARRPVT